MYRGTTPTLPFRVKGVDLTNAKLFFTIEGPNSKQITLTSPKDFTVELDGEDTIGEIILTQKQTFNLSADIHKAQIRWITRDGYSGTTVEMPIKVKDVLYKEVIRYE